MKKIFTLLAGVLLAIGAQAQTTYNFGGLTVADFTLGDAFVQGDDWVDETGSMGGAAGTSYSTISYIKKDKDNWSDLVLTGTPVIFQYKNSGEKKRFYRLFENFIYADGKGSRITVTGLTAGETVLFKVAGKNDTGCMFAAVDNCTADEANPTQPVLKTTNVDEFAEFKFTVSTDGSITVGETSAGYLLAYIVVEGGSPVTPADPYPATQWNFTTIGDADFAALQGDSENWKMTTEGNEPNQFTRFANEFVIPKVADGNNSTKLEAGGAEIDLTKGLLFGRYNNKLNAGNLRIDANKRLGLNGADVLLMIDGVATGDVVRIRYSSTNDEMRGFNVTNGTPGNFTATAEPTEQEIIVNSDGMIILQTTAGVFVYALAVNDQLPEATGISAVKAESTVNGVIYDLSGRRVDANYHGVVIMNGKKMIK